MGKWIYDTPKHVHDNPGSGSTDKPRGSIWECSCGAWFRLISTKWGGDQRDWYYTYTWTEALEKGTEITLNNGRTVIVGKPMSGDPVLGGYRDR